MYNKGGRAVAAGAPEAAVGERQVGSLTPTWSRTSGKCWPEPRGPAYGWSTIVLVMFDQTDLAELPPSARTAIQNAVERVERAAGANDVEQLVGTSKELVETVAKAAINALGGTYGSNAEMPTLVHETLTALNLHPAGLSDRPSLRKLATALASTVNALAELRNTDGTGHGRAIPSNLDPSHATLAREAAVSSCRWILAATHRALRDRVPIAQVVNDIAGPLTLSRGKLPTLLQELRIDERGEDDQFKLGLAVARRWSVNDTFLPREDVIEPLASGKAEYPPAFGAGVLEGLLLDHDGYLRMKPEDLPLVVAIGERLPGDRKVRLFEELADRARDALLSYAFKEQAQLEVVQELRRLASEREDSALGEALTAIALRIEELREPEWEDDEDEP